MANELRMNKSGLILLLAIAFLVLVFILYTGRSGYVEETVRISELIAASIHLAEKSGAKIVEIRKLNNDEIGQLSKGLTKEGMDEYVTLGDQMSHEIITSGLRAAWPNLAYKSEEKDYAVSKVPPPKRHHSEVSAIARRDESVAINHVTVWIDPLDATQEYTEGATEPDLLKYVTVMLCIAVDGKPIAGVIHEPYAVDIKTGTQGVTKWGWVGHGVSRSLQRDISSASKDGETARVIASRSHPGDVFRVAETSLKGYKTVQEMVAAGAGYKALQVAERKADLYLHTTAIKKWDICAGDAVLRTLGGKMTSRTGADVDYSLNGDPKNYDGIIATVTETEHAKYLKRLKL